MFRVDALVPYDRRDASVRERVWAWSERVSPDALVRVRGGESPLRVPRAEASNPDSTLIFRNVSRFSQGQIERQILRKASFGIYELDDGLFLDDGRLQELGAWWKPFVAKSRIATVGARSADRIIAGNDSIANWAQGFCADTVVVPTCIDPDAYTAARHTEECAHVLWIGTAATEVHLDAVATQLAEVHRRTQMQLTIVGSANRSTHSRLEPFTTRIGWYPGVEAELGTFADVGIMPLPDRPYERMKCAYKLLQYAASGMVAVGSPVGASTTVLALLRTFAPSTPGEWVDALTEAVTLSLSDRRARGRAASEAVRKQYSFEVWRTRYLAAVTPGH